MLITQVLLNRFYFCLKINQIGCFGWFQCSAQPPIKSKKKLIIHRGARRDR
jgi:hypothetical protein